MRRLKRGENLGLDLTGKRRAVVEILRLFVEAALAPVSATGNEKGDSYSLSVRDIALSYRCVVHCC